MYYLTSDLYFPPVDWADRYGLLAVGGDLSSERLVLAYRSGIFPWFQQGEPILWWAPPKRMVLFFDQLRVSKSMRNILNRNQFRVTFNTAFKEVIENCSQIYRPEQEGTWISPEMVAAYLKLHALGCAQSVEVWLGESLVGGLYGVNLGTVFCGESMFSKMPNASKVGFICLSRKLQAQGYVLLDGQLYNKHLESLGCAEIPRAAFMRLLANEKM